VPAQNPLQFLKIPRPSSHDCPPVTPNPQTELKTRPPSPSPTPSIRRKLATSNVRQIFFVRKVSRRIPPTTGGTLDTQPHDRLDKIIGIADPKTSLTLQYEAPRAAEIPFGWAFLIKGGLLSFLQAVVERKRYSEVVEGCCEEQRDECVAHGCS